MLHPGDFKMYMRLLADWVWYEQADAHSFGLTLQEETITEVLLLEMARRLSPLGLNVRMFSKPQEGGRIRNGKVLIEAEGADWEWFVQGPDRCMVNFRVQAKKLYHDAPLKDGYYGGFKPGDKQIDDLINRAAGSNPIYVLYNHPDVLNRSLFERPYGWRSDGYGASSWGCSVTTAQFMKSVGDNKLSTIQPKSLPWHHFFGTSYRCEPARSMAIIGRRQGLEADEAQPFVPASEPPRWVGMLRETGASLTEYLLEHRLRGVAHIDFSEVTR